MNILKISKLTALGFVIILALLHILTDSVKPAWQPISEYSLGNFGWLMNIAFIFLGLSFLLLGLYIYQNLPNKGSKIGAILLILASIGNFLAGTFNTDPIGTAPENFTTSGQIHSSAAGLLGLMILATIFLTYQFYKQEALKPYKTSMLIITLVLWVAELVLIGSMGYYLSKTNGVLSSETPIGWHGRIVITLCAVWIWLFANNIQKIQSKKVEK